MLGTGRLLRRVSVILAEARPAVSSNSIPHFETALAFPRRYVSGPLPVEYILEMTRVSKNDCHRIFG